MTQLQRVQSAGDRMDSRPNLTWALIGVLALVFAPTALVFLLTSLMGR